MMLVARPGHRVSQRELYGAYAQDCRAPGVAPPLDGAGFFAALRYGFFQASLVHSGEEYVVDGVALREVDDDASDEVQPEAAPAAVVPTHDPDNPFCASPARARASLAAPSSLLAHDPNNPFYSSPTAHESPKRKRPVEEAEDGARKRQRSSPEAEESDHDGACIRRTRRGLTCCAGAPAKRGRGRPKGSKNKSTLAKAVEEKPKRPIGRPPKVRPPPARSNAVLSVIAAEARRGPGGAPAAEASARQAAEGRSAVVTRSTPGAEQCRSRSPWTPRTRVPLLNMRRLRLPLRCRALRRLHLPRLVLRAHPADPPSTTRTTRTRHRGTRTGTTSLCCGCGTTFSAPSWTLRRQRRTCRGWAGRRPTSSRSTSRPSRSVRATQNVRREMLILRRLPSCAI